MSRALIIVDVQNDFCEGGSLGVTNSGDIFKYINILKKRKDFFSQIILTKDWHPKNHVSFASRHGKQPFTNIEINGKVQQLWPDHCVAESKGAELSPLLEVDGSEFVIRKGIETEVDSYSGFYEGAKGIELRDKLNELKVKEVYVVGLAYDFCVGSTALDAKKYGFDTKIVEEGTKAVSKETAQIMEEKLKSNNIPVISFDSIK